MKKLQRGFASAGKARNEVTIYLSNRKFTSLNQVWLNITYFKWTGLTHWSFFRGLIELLIGVVKTDIVKIS